MASEFTSVISGYPFSFSFSDRDQRRGVENIPNQFMDMFRIKRFVHEIKVGFPCSVALFEEGFCMTDIMDRLLRDFETGNYQIISIHRDRRFQEPFSGLTGSPGIIGAGITTGEPRGINGGTGNLLSPS